MFDKLIEFGKVLVHCGHVLCSVFEIMGTCTLWVPMIFVLHSQQSQVGYTPTSIVIKDNKDHGYQVYIIALVMFPNGPVLI